MFEWTKGNANSPIITVYDSNITLNNVAAQYFQDVAWCLIGINKASKQVAIKPVTANDIDLKLVEMVNLHKVFNGKGYSRISNKSIISDLGQLANKRFSGHKFEATYDAREKMLVFNLMKEMIKEES